MAANTEAPASSMSAEVSAQHWLKNLSKDTRRWCLQVFVVRFFQLAAQIATFWSFSDLVHTVVVRQQAVFFNQLIPFIYAMSVWALCAWLADMWSYKAKFSIEKDLERRVHDVLQSRQLSITRKFSPAYWQQLLLTNLNDVGDYLTQYSVQQWIAGIAPFVVLLVIYPVNYVVATSLLLTMPIVPLFMILIGRGAAALHRKHFVALERLSDMFADRLRGLSLITATGDHDHQRTRLEHASKVVNRNTMNVVSLAFLNNTVLDFFSTVSLALVAVFIGFSMLGELNIGPGIDLQQGLFMLLVAPLLFAELRMLGKLYHQKAKAEAGAERFVEVFEGNRGRPAAQNDSGLAWINFSVETPSLHANKLAIEPGDWIVLSGASGSGKTSLLEAMMGFRAASHSIGGELAFLSQQSCVLDKTVAFNLHLGNNTYTDNDLLKALEEVGLMDWLKGLPKGLHSNLGDVPAMSGGEAQRLSLARVLLLNKDIILLDEPTAHLTADQHQELSELINEKLSQKTLIWASHRALPGEWFNQRWHISQGEIVVSK